MTGSELENRAASGLRLRGKIFARISLLTTFLVTLSCVALALRAVYVQRTAEEKELTSVSTVLAHEIRPMLEKAPPEVMKELLNELVRTHDAMLYAAIVRKDEIYAAAAVRPDLAFEKAWGPVHGQALRGPSLTALETSLGVVNDVAVPIDGDLVLRIGMVKRGIDEETRQQIFVSLGVSLATLALGVLLSWRIAAATTREVTRAEAALLESERRYRLLFDQAPDAILLANNAHPAEVVSANEAAARLYGHAPAALLGRTLSSLFAERSRGVLLDIITGLEPGVVASQAGLSALGAGDAELPVDLTAQLVELEGRRVLQVLARDISERLRVEEDKRRLEGELQQIQKMEAIGRLAGGVAHDMNNTLGAILGTASVMRNRIGADDPDAGNLDAILRACRRGRELTRDLLGFARKGKYVRETVSLNQVAEETASLLRRATPKNVDLVVELDADLPAVEGDAGQLSHALVNVCVNAVDAMGESGRLTITTRRHVADDGGTWWPAPGDRSSEGGAFVELAVIDTGSGMDEATLARAFEPYFTTKPPGAGTGLGLSMVLGVIKSHGGHVRVRTAPGQGTTVSWLLPASSSVVAPASQPAPAPLEKAIGGRRVLLVDDEPLIRWSARKMLEELGYDVVEASSGVGAIEAVELEGAMLDAIVLDLIMPGMDGVATFEAIRTRLPDARVLIASGFTEDDKVGELLRSGARGFVEKPFDLRELAAALAKLAA